MTEGNVALEPRVSLESLAKHGRRPYRLRQADPLRGRAGAVSAGAEDRAGAEAVCASRRRRYADHADRFARSRGCQRLEQRAPSRERATDRISATSRARFKNSQKFAGVSLI